MAAPRIARLPNNPIIRPHMDARMGDNVNGPTLIRVPEWVPDPVGRYYLYFGHHRGTYIRLAYTDSLQGPWRTHEPGVLDLADSYFVKHVASPDVVVDGERRQFRLYYHGPLAEEDQHGPHARHGQATRAAVSKDGLRFTALPQVLGAPYMRVFSHGGAHYGIGMPGILYRSDHPFGPFEEGPNPFAEIAPNQRHVGLKLDGETLTVLYTNRGDCPERIFVTTIDLRPDWREWRAGEPRLVLQPEHDWEGVDEPRLPSRGGPIDGPAYQLRDPYLFTEDGRDYLLYAVAGEQGIAIAEVN